MNTTTKTILGIVVVIALLVLGVYGYRNASSRTSGTTSTDTTTTTSSEGKVAFGDIIKQGGSYVCTIDGSINATTTAKGTIYASAGKVRGDVAISTASASGTASFIARDGYIYYWNSAMPSGQGLKLKYDLSTYKEGDFDQFDKAGNYDCKEQVTDNSKFTPPTSIKFQEVAQ